MNKILDEQISKRFLNDYKSSFYSYRDAAQKCLVTITENLAHSGLPEKQLRKQEVWQSRGGSGTDRAGPLAKVTNRLCSGTGMLT